MCFPGDGSLAFKKNIFVFITKCTGLDLALNVFFAEKMREAEGVSRDRDFSYWNERNRFLLKYSQLPISQSRNSSQTTYISK